MKLPLLVSKTSFLLIYIFLAFSCSQDDSLLAELITDDTTIAESTSDDSASETVIDYENGSLEINEDNDVVLDILDYEETTSTTSKTYSLKEITQPTYGKTELNSDNEITYTPESDFNGNDTFSITVSEEDSLGTTVEKINTFEVTVNPVTDIVDDEVTTTFETAITIEPLSNDTFNESTNLAITEISLASKGIAILNSDNTITYTPSEDISGTDEISYKTTVTYTDNTTTTETGTITVTILSNEYPTGDNIKYVTTTGSSSNSGETEATAWDISHAFENAEAGDIIYIKAGNYGAVNLIVANSGTSANPIQFIGYKSIPGDIASVDGPTVSYEDYKDNDDSLDSSIMPLLEGERTNDIGIGMGIENRKNYIQISNFQIKNYEYGIFTLGDYIFLDNIITTDHGDFYTEHSYPDYTSDAFLNLTGSGIWMTDSNNCTISNSLAINNGARGIAIVGSENISMNYSSVYCDNTINPTDYYIMNYNSKNCTFKYSNVSRIGSLSHFGHGFSVKVESSFNSYENCTAYGTSFELNSNVNNNTFTDCLVQGTGETLSGGWEVTNNSYDNTFLRCDNDSGEGIVFSDWIESDGDNEINTAAYNNTFTDCTITNTVTHSGTIIDFHYNSQDGRLTSYARDNTFVNCTFSGADNLFKVDRVNSGNIFTNCTISDIESLRTSRYTINEEIDLDVTFENCTFTDISFEIPN